MKPWVCIFYSSRGTKRFAASLIRLLASCRKEPHTAQSSPVKTHFSFAIFRCPCSHKQNAAANSNPKRSEMNPQPLKSYLSLNCDPRVFCFYSFSQQLEAKRAAEPCLASLKCFLDFLEGAVGFCLCPAFEHQQAAVQFVQILSLASPGVCCAGSPQRARPGEITPASPQLVSSGSASGQRRFSGA